MDNLQICKRIAEIEGLDNRYSNCNKHVMIEMKHANNVVIRYEEYNPLTDDALCFQLMVKYEVERAYEPYDFIGWSYRCSCSLYNEDNEIVLERTYFGKGEETPDISPNKAICLAIIEAHKENSNA